MKGCGSITKAEFYRALLEEFNKLSPEDRDRLLARKSYPTAMLVREARKEASGLRDSARSEKEE